MAEEASEVELVVQALAGEPTTGAWCDRCLLPSAITVPFTLHVGSGISTSVLGTVEVIFCEDCGSNSLADDGVDHGQG